MRKTSTSFYFDNEIKQIIARLAKQHGLSQASLIAMLVRKEERRLAREGR